jgi:enoyl-CoA hydratase/carnithine racemase
VTARRFLERTPFAGGVLVTIDRPELRNAIDLEMVEQLHALCDELEREPRILILTGGTNGVFAAGADIGELLHRGVHDALAGINMTVFQRIHRLPMPTIAAIDGYALGGGAELAYACDLRVASERAVFGQPEAGLGILAAAGGSWRLRELVGEAVAKEMLFLDRRLDAEEALRLRLVSRVTTPELLLDTARELADRMLRNSPLALRLTKLAVNAPAEAHPVVDVIAQAVLFESQDKKDRMEAFLARRGRPRSADPDTRSEPRVAMSSAPDQQPPNPAGEPSGAETGRPGDQTGPNVCPACGGTATTGDRPCPTCGGTGTVQEVVGDA